MAVVGGYSQIYNLFSAISAKGEGGVPPQFRKKKFCENQFLSPSGDLGIGLVWDNPTGPDPTGPHFGPTVEILFKLN